MIPDFQSIGREDQIIERSNINFNGYAISYLTSFRTLGCNKSGPGDLYTFKFPNLFIISSLTFILTGSDCCTSLSCIMASSNSVFVLKTLEK